MMTEITMNSQTSKPTSPPASLSIDQFCERYGIDKVTYWRMRNRGEGPAEVRIGTRTVRITEAAAAEWEARHTHPPEQASQPPKPEMKRKVLR